MRLRFATPTRLATASFLAPLVLVLVGCSDTSAGEEGAVGGNQAGSAGGVSIAGNPNTAGVGAMGGSATIPAGGTTSGQAGAAPSTGGATSGQAGTTSGQAGTTSGQAGVSGAGMGTGGSPSVVANAIFAAPNGSSDAAGTLDDPTTLASAVAKVSAGGTIYLRGGKYALTSTVGLSKTGSSASPINLRSYPLDAERPLLDFTNQASGGRGLSVSGSYWHVYAIDVYNAGDNCMYVGGSNNTIEFMTFSECEDSGLQLGGGAANNLVLNCDSYFNADASQGNADGFAAKLDVGSGNKFVGCRAWNNSDDGWDGYLRGADNVSTSHEDCWAIDNGKLKDGTLGSGDGNGFKTGGSDDKALSHNATYARCISTGNVHDGFDHNSNRGSVTMRNCAAHGNGNNINFSTTNIAASLTIKNTISVGTNGSLTATTTDITNNSWQNGLSATNADFVSTDVGLLKSKRQSDGSLPDIAYLKLASGSDLRNAGIDVGMPYSGSAPDLGPFESVE
jgi:hypothetical protein